MPRLAASSVAQRSGGGSEGGCGALTDLVTNYWSTPEVNLALFKAIPNVPALKAALEQIKASDPLVVKVADAGRKSGQIMPSIPEMAAVWDPLGKAEAAVVAGSDPNSIISAAGKGIQASLK